MVMVRLLLHSKRGGNVVCLFHFASFLLSILPRRCLFTRCGSRQTGGEIAHFDFPLKRTVSVVSLSAILRLCESFSPTISRLLISPFIAAPLISKHLLPSRMFRVLSHELGLIFIRCRTPNTLQVFHVQIDYSDICKSLYQMEKVDPAGPGEY